MEPLAQDSPLGLACCHQTVCLGLSWGRREWPACPMSYIASAFPVFTQAPPVAHLCSPRAAIAILLI